MDKKENGLKTKLADAAHRLTDERTKADKTDWIGNDPPDRQ